ncbi:MAG: hypothetical protein V7K67_16930 [Nostoc sp.]|uniref:hypothetical protein n=1 Tax=Nostoc sp. TaxID=1180 RepID=UPI002FF509F9
MADPTSVQVPQTINDTGGQFPPTSVIATGATLTPVTTTVTAATPPEDALPDDYDPFQHLKQVYYPQHNSAVALFFNDLGSDWKPNIATARSSLRVACTITPDDNELLIAMRHRLFWDLLGYGKSDLFLYQGSIDAITQPATGHPKVTLYFSQDRASVPAGGIASDMEVSFRLMNYTGATYTKTLATSLANLIKSEFLFEGTGLVFTKGKNIYNYLDVAHGYRLLIRGNDQASATTLITQLLNLQEIAFDENKLSISTPEKSNLVGTVPAQQMIYGIEVNLPRYRPTVNVRFRYAFVKIPGLLKNIVLFDATGRRLALVH